MEDKFKGLAVTARPNEDVEKLIRRFVKKVRNDGVLQEAYIRRAYEKPSVKRRRKATHARFLRKTESDSE